MKYSKHPKTFKTCIILTDGSSIDINWVYYKKILKVNSDYLTHNLWKNKKIKTLLNKKAR